MDDEKDVSSKNENESTKESSIESVGLKGKLKTLYVEHISEFRKIIWPSRQDLLKHTVTVVVISLIFGAYIAGLDAVLFAAFNQFVKFIG